MDEFLKWQESTLMKHFLSVISGELFFVPWTILGQKGRWVAEVSV